jgi:alpha-methylacyl-CoA racemase
MAFGVVCALLEARRSGCGQVVDAAMIDGSLSFMAMFFGYRELGMFFDQPGAGLLGGGAHYYDVYETSDGKYLSVAPIEPQFYRAFVQKMRLDADRFLPAGYPAHDPETVQKMWPALKVELTACFKTRTRDEWCALFEGSDACVQPVLSLAEAADHPHNRARGLFVDVGGVQQNAPAPRFSRTAAAVPRAPRKVGEDTAAVLADWGVQ